MTELNQDQHPNFRNDGKLCLSKMYLVRCFRCGPARGRENYAMAVAKGSCWYCGWHEGADDGITTEPECTDPSFRASVNRED